MLVNRSKDSIVVGEKAEEAPTAVAVLEPKPPERKTYTNWKALGESGLKPTYIRCDGYRPVHIYNNGCHTALSLDPEKLAKHLDGDHGGGYFISFREGIQTDPIGASQVRTGRHWDGWEKFEELGLEIRDFRCEICDAEIKINSRSILKHIRPHSGKYSRARPGGDFWLTITRNLEPDPDEDE